MSTPKATLHCPRCAVEVAVTRPWRGWRRVGIAWCGLLLLALALSPFLAADYCVMLPSLMVFLAAAGPMYTQARRRPACRRCLLELDESPSSRRARSEREAPRVF